MDERIVKETPKLGFGLMRLPKRFMKTDIPQVEQMVDLFLENGMTYFDTAFVYGSSEKDIKKALVDRYPREDYTLATKLFAMAALNEKKAQEQFFKSLDRTGAGYFDYYLLHSLMGSNVKRYDKFKLWDFVNEQKEKGLIKNIGFSFHSNPILLDRLLTEHPEIDFVQLQLNYKDWNSPNVSSRENYEVARKHNKPIVVMEPVKGGNLANPKKEIEELFRSYNPNASNASWAIRFAASLDGILTVLSGMSNVEQMKDNLSFMKNFEPLNNEEQEIIRKAQSMMGDSVTIDCTNCHYCTKGCPKEVPIPEIFNSLNLELGNGQMEEAKKLYSEVTKNASASDCIDCKQCERTCPQHLEITKNLKKANEIFDY